MNRFHFNNVSLRNKLLLVYFVSVFIPIILTNIIFYHVTTENVKTQKKRDLSLAVEQMANEFNKGVDNAVGVSNALYTDNVLYSFLEKQHETLADFVRAYNTDFRDINRYVPIYSSVRSISVYTDNETAIYAGGIYPIDHEVKASHWYKITNINRRSFPVVTRTRGDSGRLDTFNVIRELNYYNHNTTQKILKIELNTAFIDRSFNNVTFPGDVYLVNEDGAIEYTTNSDIPWSERSYQFDSVSIPNDTVVLEDQYNSKHLNKWKVIGVVPENALVVEVRNSLNFILYLAVGNFVLPSLFIIFISSSLHMRLSRIVRHMRKVEDQDFDLIDDVIYQDEIGELTIAFNRMSKKIKELINDVYLARIQKKDLELQRKQAQISALQSQINPHFLFNVLETIRMRSILKEEDETAKIIENMANLLRTSITWSKEWVTVREEIQLIKSFLEIQQYRFGDKLQYAFDIDESTLDFTIPSMSLIPFVENANIHGIERLKEKGKIEIKIRQSDKKLKCLIQDNGVGIEKEKLEQLYRSLEDNELVGENIGIKNVYHRLKMHYNDQFDFQIESSKGKGTLVKVSIPVK